MEIRPATSGDWGWVLPLMKDVHKDAPYNHIDCKVEDMKRTFMTMTRSKTGLAIVVVDKKKKVHGLLMAQVVKNWWGARVANELFTYSQAPRTTHRLIKQYKQWADEQKVDIATMVNTSGENERYEKLISRMGFKKAGGAFLR